MYNKVICVFQENCQRDYDTVTLEREKQILQYTLACNYVDTGRFHEAESLHYAVKDCLEKYVIYYVCSMYVCLSVCLAN